MAESPPVLPNRQDTKYPPFPRAPYYYTGQGGDGGGLEQRRVTRIRTAPIGGVDGKVNGQVTLPRTAGATLLDFAASQDTWFRLYASAADREADRFRTIDTFPPSTPIIFDGLVKGGALASDALDRTLWGAGPDCTNPDSIGFALDGDGSTWWATDYYLGSGHPSAADMAIGDVFSVDFGVQITIGSFSINNGTGVLALPKTIKIETSQNGVTWTTQIASYEPLVSDPYIAFSTAFACRYLKLTILTINPTPGPWQIADIYAYASDQDALKLRLWNGDEAGIPCFNWDDVAQDTWYYAAQCDPDVLYNIYFARYGWVKCQLWGWNTSGPGGTLVVFKDGPPEFENCILTGSTPPLSGAVQYVDPGGLRPRYFNNGNELRAFGLDGNIVKIDARPSSLPEAVAQLAFTRSSAVDTSAFSVGICYYVADAGNFNTLSRLSVGITRSGSTAIKAFISWQDDSTATTALASGSDFTCGLGQGGTLTTEIATDVDDNVVCNAYINGVLQCSAIVPTYLLDRLGTHNSVGFFSGAADPPGSPLAWGGMGINAIAVAGATGQAVIDIGYVPMEIPGGTLKRPLNGV